MEDEPKALHLLRQISYYRLSAYWYPFLQDKKKHIFKPGASFDAAFRLYCFDRELRHLIQCELEKIEIAVRTQVIYVLSHRHGSFWFAQSNLFSNEVQYASTLEKIKHEHSRSDESFIKTFNENYSDSLPPSWMLLEIVSFGTLSQLYKNLKPGREKRAIANSFGLSDSVFETWLHSIVYLRNVCAHHTRLWNRVMRIQPALPITVARTWLLDPSVSNRQCYFMFSIICFLLDTVNPGHRFKQKLSALFSKYPQVDKRAMGFPDGWENEPLWE